MVPVSNKSENVWCVVPAAGSGSRMRADVPKQYLELGGEPVLAHAVRVFRRIADIHGIAVGLSPDDVHWPDSAMAGLVGVHPFEGGESRAETVLNGLDHLRSALDADPADWVMVHDAARPLLEGEDVERLLRACRERDCGGILAAAMVDTVKRADGDGMVIETEQRERLWRALTPQCFRLGPLSSALRDALDNQIAVTDESMAMERCGHPVQLVPGSPGNIKITSPSDLELARHLLRS